MEGGLFSPAVSLVPSAQHYPSVDIGTETRIVFSLYLIPGLITVANCCSRLLLKYMFIAFAPSAIQKQLLGSEVFVDPLVLESTPAFVVPIT